jgi:hypothetical protein
MSKDGFTLYSTAYISREEYMDWLRQLNAVMIPEEGGVYDARLSRGVRHVWISLLEEDEVDMDMRVMEDDVPEVLAEIRQLLGGEPKSAIVLVANDAVGSKILAVQFAAACAEHHPCVVCQEAGNAIFSARELLKLRDAGMGFDGFTWEKAARFRLPVWNTGIIEEENKREEAKRRVVRDFKEHFTDLQA